MQLDFGHIEAMIAVQMTHQYGSKGFSNLIDVPTIFIASL